MFSSLRTRFGIPGVISVIALVFAMLGGAYAANNSSGGGKATASAKAKKGPRGPKGATGPAGPAGPAGAKGDNGAAGSNGADGAKGTTGAAGQSVTTSPIGPFGECGEQEGVKLTSASGNSKVCDGAEGPQGPPGEPWTGGGTLPAAATETGTWAAVIGPGVVFGFGFGAAPLSFTVPLTAALSTTGCDTQPQPTTCQVHLIMENGKELVKNSEEDSEEVTQRSPTPCTGSALNPKAISGNVCAYINTGGEFIAERTFFLTSPAGVTLKFFSSAIGQPIEGSWAVTG